MVVLIIKFNLFRDFPQYITFLIEEKHLKEGDILVMDNCRIHCANDSFFLLSTLLKDAGIKMIFLPKYSPELNSCENCFGKMKQSLQNSCRNMDFKLEIATVAAEISYFMMYNFYTHCVPVQINIKN